MIIYRLRRFPDCHRFACRFGSSSRFFLLGLADQVAAFAVAFSALGFGQG